MATCSKCGTTENIGWDKVREKPKRICRPCHAAKMKQYTRDNKDRINARNQDRRFGLAPGEYDSMMERQGGLCAICKEPCRSGRRLAVDHCHTTGKVRGLLCASCNRGIGYLADSPERLRSALTYLGA